MTRKAERRALAWGAAVAALTTVHHVYGAIVYQTPSRYHAVFLAGGALVVMLGALSVAQRRGRTRLGQAAWWTFFGVTAVVFVLLFGAFEGAYNHLLKNALWLAGLPVRALRVLFPAPTYELPNDLFFELTGIAQVLPAAMTAGWLATLLAERRSGVTKAPLRARGRSRKAPVP
jgi:hypothetical protein